MRIDDYNVGIELIATSELAADVDGNLRIKMKGLSSKALLSETKC